MSTHINAANKGDIAKYPRECDIITEAKSGKNVDKLVALISESLDLNKRLQAPALTRERQIFAVGEALEAVNSAIDGLNINATLDCVVVDVKTAYSALASLTGEDVAENVVEEIFSKFCVGK